MRVNTRKGAGVKRVREWAYHIMECYRQQVLPRQVDWETSTQLLCLLLAVPSTPGSPGCDRRQVQNRTNKLAKQASLELRPSSALTHDGAYICSRQALSSLISSPS